MTTMMIDDGAFSDALKTLSSTESFLDANKCSVEPLLLIFAHNQENRKNGSQKACL